MMKAKILYIAGNEDAGKTPTCRNINKLLQKKSFIKKDKEDLSNGDYIIYREKGNVHVVVCTASDLKEIIDKLKEFLEKICKHLNGEENVLLILAIRNTGDSKRDYLEKMVNGLFQITDKIEIPLARISEKAGKDVHKWYHKAVDEIVEHTLKNNPFNI